MVPLQDPTDGRVRGVFQYSLCRVVLMVLPRRSPMQPHANLSVLALSSRFDGPSHTAASQSTKIGTFSTRSVESF